MSTESVAATVREAIANRTRVRISGAATWMNGGRPVLSDTMISMSSDSGIVDYVPDDLTITVRAGTPLSEIAAVTGANGQWLPLDPPGSRSGTIGATIATASSGPLAHSFGFARDFVLGLELVTGKGDVIKSGGRVVKNVAGFDLMRLNCGAWGTLGVITQTSLRLYARPKVDRTFALEIPVGANATQPFFHLLRNAPLSALTMEGVNGKTAAALGLHAASVVLIRLAGNEKLVDAQLATLCNIGSPTEVDADIWTRLSEQDPSVPDVALRLSGLPSNAHLLWKNAHTMVESADAGHLHSTFSKGVVRVALRGVRDEGLIPAPSAAQRVTYEVLPPNAWKAVSPSVTSDALSQNVKRAFDPHALFNPGIL
ncbi:MAG: FAD-binding protein, partial [Gemmatimonadota bacterium]|nr:FAD-binding protein [Gemmatimonadota bacterium]